MQYSRQLYIRLKTQGERARSSQKINAIFVHCFFSLCVNILLFLILYLHFHKRFNILNEIKRMKNHTKRYSLSTDQHYTECNGENHDFCCLYFVVFFIVEKLFRYWNRPPSCLVHVVWCHFSYIRRVFQTISV